jgi:hypothetical protein
MNERLRPLMSRLTDQTVLGQFLEPVERALERVRIAPGSFRVLGALDFLTLGVLRHIQAMGVMREQIQALLHLAPRADERAPLARSTWSDALSSPQRLHLTQAVRPRVLAEARALLPDRLAGIPGLGDRPVYALDGTYQAESAHYPRCTPRQGGEDNPKGHGLLSFYDLRLGCPQDVLVETRSRHETAVLKDYDRLPHAVTQVRRTVWVVDRGFIDAPFWDAKKATLGCTVITRMKRGLSIDSTEARPIAPLPLSQGVQRDLLVHLHSSPHPWRLVTYRSRRGRTVEFLTNDFTLEPGVIAFLYSRRWEEEKCFDTWKNDLAQAKAWAQSRVAIEQQVLLALLTSVLIALLLHQALGAQGSQDEKALKKQDRRQRSTTDGTDRPDWTVPLFRWTSKISRQVWRFFKGNYLPLLH